MPVPTPVATCDPWPVNDVCDEIPDDNPAMRDFWILVASQYLWSMTGRRIGPSCPITVRPCRKACGETYWPLNFWPAGWRGFPWIPYVGRDGNMYNASLCGCRTECHCGPEMCEIRLRGPVYDIVSVDLDGTVISPTTYHVYDGERLVRLNPSPLPDGQDANCWPTCQNLTAAPGSQDTFTVTYRTGLEVPTIGVAAVSALAAHFIRGCGDGCGCGVGTRQNLQRLTRQGVELEFADPQELFDDGRTGIEIVDFFIRTMNPQGLASPLRVLSPDAPKYGKVW
jgi:hypothetical protein